MTKKVVRFGTYLLAATLFFSNEVRAYSFTPSEVEWNTWPGYCKAKYAWTNIGRTSKFANRVTASDRQELITWENAGVRGAHHHCAGTIWLQRARLESDERQRTFMLSQALSETQFTYERSRTSSVYFPYIAMQMSTILHEQGKSQDAIVLLQSQLQANPTSASLYSALAIIQRKAGRLSDAKATLLEGHEYLEGKSAEISYNLALVCIETGELDAAEKYARIAYDLGYPLPGLRVKLEKLGRLK